jgi:ABC-2 type transport system permease protein
MNAALFWQVMLRVWKAALRRPVHLSFSLAQPLMWMLFFGFLMKRFPLDTLPASVDYTSFLLPGICAMTVLFGASQVGIGLIRDMQTGFLQRMLASPAPRWVLLGGKVAADGVRLLVQAVIVLLFGAAMGATVNLAPVPLLAGFIVLFFFAVAFGSLSCFIALRARKQETMAAFVHIVNMPIFFTSTALVPGKEMTGVLAWIAAWNPLRPVVEALRGAVLFRTVPAFESGLMAVLLLAFLMTGLAVWEMGRSRSVSAWEARR